MADAQSRVTVTFVGADAGLTATAGAINTQLGSSASNAATLTGRFGELTAASQNYANNLKSTSAESEKLFKNNAALTSQRIKEEFAAQAAASKELAAAQKAQQAEAEKIFQTNARLSAQRVREEFAAQAVAERELAAAQRQQQAEAEKLFQTNAKLTQQNVADQIEKQRQGYQTLAVGSGAVTAGLLGVGKSALDAEVKLDAAQRKVSTISTDSEGLTTTLRGVSTELKNQASTTELLAASYDILSSGFADNASAAKITKQAVLGATAGFSDAGTVGNALTSVLNAYKLSADDAGSVTDKLVATQNAGKITVDEYARQIGKLAPLAAQAGVGLDELNGFVATATLSGVQSEAAFTGLRQGIAAVLKPSSDATKESAKLGIAFDAQALKTKGLAGILQELKEKGADTPEILLKLFGSVEAVTAIAPSAGAGFKKLQENIDASKNSAGSAQKAFDQVAGSLENQTKQTLNKINEALTVIGSDIAPAIGSVVGVAGQLVDVFLKLPAPIQGVLIASAGFVGVLSAAVLVISAYNLANNALQLGTAASTLATIAETLATQGATAARFLFTTQITLASVELAIFDARLALSTAATTLYTAVTEGAAVALGGLSTALLTVVAPLAALAAGVAIVGLVKLTEQIADQNNALEELRQSTDQVLQSGISAETKLKGAIDARNESKKTGIALTQQQLDKEKESLKQSEGTLNLLKQQLAQAEKTPQAQAGFGGFGKDEADAQNRAREANIASLKQQVTTIEAQRKALEGATAATDANSKATSGNKDDRKKEAKDDAEELKEDRQDEKTQESATFQDAQKEKQQQFQDEERQKDQSYTDAKQKRETAFKDTQTAIDKRTQTEKQQREATFQDAQAVIEKQNQAAKQQREATFQDAQAAIDKQNQAEKQQREATFQAEQQKAEVAFKAAQTKRDEGQKGTQTEAGQQLSLEGARGKDRRNLVQQQQTQANVSKLDDADLQNLTPEQLAALAKKSAGVGTIRNKDEEQRAQDALKQISDRQNKLLKEQERQEEEAFKAKQKAEDLKFKQEQEAIDAQKELAKRERDRAFKVEQTAIDTKNELEKRDRDRAFKTAQEAIDTKNEAEKQGRERAFKTAQDAQDRQHEADKRDAARSFEASQREAERTFKDEQRQKDRENAEKVKDIIESAKVKAPDATPDQPGQNVGSNPIADVNATPRFAGGPVLPGVTYLGGERGVERIDFGVGRDALVGSRGPQLFRVNQPGFVYPHTSEFTQNLLHPQTQVVNTVHHQHQTMGRSPNVHVTPATVVYSDDALLREMRQLRSQVEAMRPINQNFDIATQNPMAEVYAAMKQAARLKG